MNHNFTSLIVLPGQTFPVAFTTAAPNKESAARAAHLNNPGCLVMAVVKLPAKAPDQFKMSTMAFNAAHPKA